MKTPPPANRLDVHGFTPKETIDHGIVARTGVRPDDVWRGEKRPAGARTTKRGRVNTADAPPGTPRLPLALIAAVARNGVIGADNRLPWSLPSDLRHFRALTMGKPVLMGRRTYDSIGRPLPGRFVVVVSRDAGFAPEGVRVARSLAAALDLGQTVGGEHGAGEVLVAGGGTLYAALIGIADRLYITAVDTAPDGDIRFPAIDPSRWLETGRVAGTPGPRDDAAFAFLTFERLADEPRTASV